MAEMRACSIGSGRSSPASGGAVRVPKRNSSVPLDGMLVPGRIDCAILPLNGANFLVARVMRLPTDIAVSDVGPLSARGSVLPTRLGGSEPMATSVRKVELPLAAADEAMALARDDRTVATAGLRSGPAPALPWVPRDGGLSRTSLKGRWLRLMDSAMNSPCRLATRASSVRRMVRLWSSARSSVYCPPGSSGLKVCADLKPAPQLVTDSVTVGRAGALPAVTASGVKMLRWKAAMPPSPKGLPSSTTWVRLELLPRNSANCNAAR
mmetsp:Transcript_54472/g.143887  ORF Transcript_54472/g.143887 Transcript_54472/m.143887 type:complete len:266 (+) Transcript_54472:390-1187(+)